MRHVLVHVLVHVVVHVLRLPVACARIYAEPHMHAHEGARDAAYLTPAYPLSVLLHLHSLPVLIKVITASDHGVRHHFTRVP